ncbi:MAG: response regulator [Chloroflexi bacterium]|nr:MAG: response regulator [Chloroflexota bacterium]
MAAPRIAIVNHDPVFLRLIDRLLTLEDFDVVVCPSGTLAHEVIVKAQPQLVMLDTWLEDRDAGWMLLQTLQLDERVSGIPVLICTSDREEFDTRVHEGGPSNLRCIQKPFKPETLVSTIREMLTP